jgi:hypothetical protein
MRSTRYRLTTHLAESLAAPTQCAATRRVTGQIRELAMYSNHVGAAWYSKLATTARLPDVRSMLRSGLAVLRTTLMVLVGGDRLEHAICRVPDHRCDVTRRVPPYCRASGRDGAYALLERDLRLSRGASRTLDAWANRYEIRDEPAA